mmetsp:Transcript_125303/g.366011  ORF Transcript_125303/g.366011 Transcript_125303/m.366011 type:complete len:86 (-) Transcript_125303:118-375(-)
MGLWRVRRAWNGSGECYLSRDSCSTGGRGNDSHTLNSEDDRIQAGGFKKKETGLPSAIGVFETYHPCILQVFAAFLRLPGLDTAF